MKNLFEAGKLLLLDMASTFFFLVLYLLTHNITLSVVLGMALGVAQIGWQYTRRQPIDTMQWMSLFLVLGSGAATLLTSDPRFVMVKPSVIYLVVGIVMLKPGWMNRYLPPVAIELVPDVAFIFGFVWAALMFFSAALNLIVALNFSVVTWSAFMSLYAIVSKAVLFLIGYATSVPSGYAAAAPRWSRWVPELFPAGLRRRRRRSSGSARHEPLIVRSRKTFNLAERRALARNCAITAVERAPNWRRRWRPC